MPSTIARNLRRNPTEAERQLWSRLRGRQLDGHRFRRQVPLGAFVVDFACLSARLVIEVDGGQHAWQTDHDETRTRWLHANGFRVLRFWNNDVLGNIEGVLQTIQLSLQDHASHPPPRPSPSRGEGDDLAHPTERGGELAPTTAGDGRAEADSPTVGCKGVTLSVSLPPCGGASLNVSLRPYGKGSGTGVSG